MKIAQKEGDGFTIREVAEPKGEYLEITPEIEERIKSYEKPILLDDYSDIVENLKQE